MPRSFLLRRNGHAQDEAKLNGKVQNKGRKIGLMPDSTKLSYGPFNGNLRGKETPFSADTKDAVNGFDLAPYTYQSYIDGDTIKKNNNIPTAVVNVGQLEANLKSQSQMDDVDGSPQELLETFTEDVRMDNSDGMTQPQANVSGTKPVYRCEQCGKTFKTKYTLTIHLKMPSHTGARPFVCNICGKGFRLSSTLCRHKIIHTSDKPHKCHICQKAFNRSSTLKTHIRTHSEKKEFLCEVCGKGFHQKGNLRNHFLIHTGEKPYRCRLCNKAFNKLSNLKFHLHVHTDNTPYRCRYCKTAFSRRCDLKHHIRTGHGQHSNAEYFDGEES